MANNDPPATASFNPFVQRTDMSNTEYYQKVQDTLFNRVSSKLSLPLNESDPRVVFIIHKEFSDLVKFLVYDFIVAFYQNYGREVFPKVLEKGCAKLTLEFSNTKDYRELDFRKVIVDDPDYHYIFKRFSVDRIFAYKFPDDLKFPTREPVRFKTDISGKPQPY